MKVLVTGGEGYVGSVLCPYLSQQGHEVTSLDRGFFSNDDTMGLFEDNKIRIVRDDIRYFDPSLLRSFDAVVDLAALSNDPAGDLDPLRTIDINYAGRSRVARLAKAAGVKRYVVASSCSTYGFQDHVVDETAGINPLTTYAKANRMVEEDNLLLGDADFTPVALRFATAFGFSPRLRLDIAINAMTYHSMKNGKVKLMRDGNQYRPFVHVKDMARAIDLMLHADQEKISGQIFNVGSDDQNVQLKDVARMVIGATGIDEEIEWYGDPDTRSYQVSFRKIRETLGFNTEYGIEYGIKEMRDEFSKVTFSYRDDMMTVNHYRGIMEAEQTISGVRYDMGARTI